MRLILSISGNGDTAIERENLETSAGDRPPVAASFARGRGLPAVRGHPQASLYERVSGDRAGGSRLKSAGPSMAGPGRERTVRSGLKNADSGHWAQEPSAWWEKSKSKDDVEPEECF